LFPYAGDAEGVYEAFQRDFDRDTWIEAAWRFAVVICALGAVFASHHPDWLWLFGGIYAAERALSKFVDNSNRNKVAEAQSAFTVRAIRLR